MEKRIFRFLIIISFLTLILSTTTSTCIYYGFYLKENKEDLINILNVVRVGLNNTNSDIDYLNKITKDKKNFRLSLIDKDGEVLFDNDELPKFLDSHKNRPEFIKSKKYGFAEISRYSVTLGKYNYYISYQLEDGNIIRISRTIDSTLGAFLKLLPMDIAISLFIFILGIYISRKIAKKTLEPLNNLAPNFENIDINEFPEISPFIKKIKSQNNTIVSNLRKMKREKDTIETIFANMKEALIIVDENKNILSVNKSARAVFTGEKDFVGKSILNLIRDENIINLINKALASVSAVEIIEIQTREYKTYINPVYEDRDVKGVILLFIDETEQLEALRLREEFSSNVSHELKTPLTSISGFSELLVNNMVDESNKKEFYELIYRDSKRLLDLIEDIMKISGLESDASFEKEEIDLNKLFKDIFFSQKNFIEEKNISVNLDGDAVIYENKTMIWELFENLISNAIKYNKEDGSIDVKISDDYDYIDIEIKDRGIGIAARDLSRIFERFYRVDKSRAKKNGGTGLGLAIVKHIIKRMGADLKVSSKVGIGTTFNMRLYKKSGRK